MTSWVNRTATAVTDDFHDAVRFSADRLPLAQAHALWLVDVCHTTYTQGAIETGTTPKRFAKRAHVARTTIRNTLPGPT